MHCQAAYTIPSPGIFSEIIKNVHVENVKFCIQRYEK